jgi:glycosyltransferase involved in cell wall biosynthesis
MREKVASAYPACEDKLAVITNGYEDLESIPQPRPRQAQMVVSHVGSISARRWPKILVDAMEFLRRTRPDVASEVCLQFVGANQGGPSLTDYVTARGVGDLVREIGTVGSKASREYMRSSDVLVLFEPTEPHVLPGKIFEYLAARRPILCLTPPGSDSAQLITESGAGTNADLGDPTSVAAVLAEYWRLWRDDNLKVVVDETWLGQFHRRALTGKLAELLDQAVARARPGLLVELASVSS